MMRGAQQCDLASLKCPVQYGSNSMFYVGVTFTTIKKFFLFILKRVNPRTWCTGKTQWVRVVWVVGGGIGMGNTCKSMANSYQSMTKTTTIL